MPDMPSGKPAGVRCVHLTRENECRIYGRPERPSFCLAWSPSPELCGNNLDDAMQRIAALDVATGRGNGLTLLRRMPSATT